MPEAAKKADPAKKAEPAKKADPAKKPDAKKDAPKKEEPKKDAPKKDDPKKAAPKKDEPKKDAPKKDEAKKAEPKKDEPKKDAPKKDEPKKDDPKKAEPKKVTHKEEPSKEDTTKDTSEIQVEPSVKDVKPTDKKSKKEKPPKKEKQPKKEKSATGKQGGIPKFLTKKRDPDDAYKVLFGIRAAELVFGVVILAVTLGSDLPFSRIFSTMVNMGVAGPIIPIFCKFNHLAFHKRALPFYELLVMDSLCLTMYALAIVGIVMSFPVIMLNESKYFIGQLMRIVFIGVSFLVMCSDILYMLLLEKTHCYESDYK